MPRLIRGSKTDFGGVFPGLKIDIHVHVNVRRYWALRSYYTGLHLGNCTAGHTDNADYAGFATILSELCSKSDIMPHYANFPQTRIYAENYASLIRQSLHALRVVNWRIGLPWVLESHGFLHS